MKILVNSSRTQDWRCYKTDDLPTLSQACFSFMLFQHGFEFTPPCHLTGPAAVARRGVVGLPARGGLGLGASVAAQTNRCCWSVRRTRSNGYKAEGFSRQRVFILWTAVKNWVRSAASLPRRQPTFAAVRRRSTGWPLLVAEAWPLILRCGLELPVQLVQEFSGSRIQPRAAPHWGCSIVHWNRSSWLGREFACAAQRAFVFTICFH